MQNSIHNYFGGEPPAKKKKTSETDKLYEKEKRSRKFQASWTKEFTWLVEANHDTLYCTVCRSVYGHLSHNKLKDSTLPNIYSNPAQCRIQRIRIARHLDAITFVTKYIRFWTFFSCFHLVYYENHEAL